MNVSKLLVAGIVVAGLAATARGDSPRSGPEVGSHVSAFDVHDITGKFKGKKLCYV